MASAPADAAAAEPAAAAAGPSSIPVTMLSGFLGAGAFVESERGMEKREREKEKERGTLRAQAFPHLLRHRSSKKLSPSPLPGKTTVLRHLLQNSSHLRIGCVVNDVADVNIDAKLVRNDRSRQRNNKNNNGAGGSNGENDGDKNNNTTSDLADTIELANGCACCSIQDELFGSFEQLLSLADAKGATYDR